MPSLVAQQLTCKEYVRFKLSLMATLRQDSLPGVCRGSCCSRRCRRLTATRPWSGTWRHRARGRHSTLWSPADRQLSSPRKKQLKVYCNGSCRRIKPYKPYTSFHYKLLFNIGGPRWCEHSHCIPALFYYSLRGSLQISWPLWPLQGPQRDLWPTSWGQLCRY